MIKTPFFIFKLINNVMILYSMKIKEQTRKLAAGCSKHCFEVVDKTDEVSYIYLRQGDVDAV
ncbi:hypothetical protein EQH27_00605 [Streptococcus pneumoniae]|nr:hypothetical protein HMPREF0837_10376 [Streptococcus pneumoniae TCH8431/19A]AVV90497.1 hypothetical protein DA395_00680 [Streptococcus pneumoniae]EDK71520.1 hypothetical protein CGSSp19BS75_10878 [Streptococcus pneumoniae SP19-BS75]EDK77359.1 hypothetical protein CGSSp6BS73_09931 [Streptococcus pneumoniae SP6-BS73]KAA00930.1 hypothetical protein SP1UMMC_08100 [Streptococcus pneumoniae DAR831]KAA03808.1 hypothetical protein SP2UMMC_01945 [Streptococcus pneumoniae DAR3264]OYL03461.1 hypothet